MDKILKPCIIFDIDGTLANCSHRVHHVNGKKKDWVAFMKGIPDDKPILQTLWLNWVLQDFLSRDRKSPDVYTPIFLCSGRSEDERGVTEAWLNRNHIDYDKMFMRKSKDYRADYVIKRELLDEIRAEGYDPFIIFDDRQCVTDMWRNEGLFVLQCDPKPSMTHHHGFTFGDHIKWPLTILVGPSGAGKTTWIREYKDEYPANVISSDDIRQMLTGDFKDQSQNDKVFEVMHEMAKVQLRAGLPVVLDATHLKNKDRIKAATLVPDTVPVRYVVVNRPLDEKKRTGGWRAGVSVKGKTLIEHHDQVFKSNKKDILKGDGLPNVTVEVVDGA